MKNCEKPRLCVTSAFPAAARAAFVAVGLPVAAKYVCAMHSPHNATGSSVAWELRNAAALAKDNWNVFPKQSRDAKRNKADRRAALGEVARACTTMCAPFAQEHEAVAAVKLLQRDVAARLAATTKPKGARATQYGLGLREHVTVITVAHRLATVMVRCELAARASKTSIKRRDAATGTIAISTPDRGLHGNVVCACVTQDYTCYIYI